MIRQVRNRGRVPDVNKEGIITKPIPPRLKPANPWYAELSPFERCYAHQTLASVRRYAPFKKFSDLIPSDSLDFILVSVYNHNDDLFGNKVDPCLQPETIGVHTWRRLRNTTDLDPLKGSKAPVFSFNDVVKKGQQLEPYNKSHPVLMGGVKEREDLYHVKLMNSSHHSPQTNAGYCRQDRDGSFFMY